MQAVAKRMVDDFKQSGVDEDLVSCGFLIFFFKSGADVSKEY